MLQKLGDHIRACRVRANECEAAAMQATDPTLRQHLQDLGLQWNHLATSYEFVESLERFLLDQHNNSLPREVEKLPKDGPEL
jgi:hypothetical protein